MAKQPTEKQLEARRKFAEKARQRAADKKAKAEATTVSAPNVAEIPEIDQGPQAEPQVTISQADYFNLQRQVLELKEMMLNGALAQAQAQPNQVGVQGGKLVGSLTKYSLAPTDYPDPTGRLFQEPRLARFALNINYDLMWKVTTVEYTTIDNVRVKEPRFTLELGRKLFDEETGEPVLDENGDQKGYIISRFIMHEDPDAALAIARQEQVDVDETNEKEFLDEMRYLRCRDWLLECFFPTPVKKETKKDMVIGGKVVETYSITSPTSEKIPFNKIKDGMYKS